MAGPRCPWCGRWEIEASDDLAKYIAGETITLDCEVCERPFSATAHFTVTWTVTRTTKQSAPTDPVRCECGALLPAIANIPCPVCDRVPSFQH
jgi:hypothetical protein